MGNCNQWIHYTVVCSNGQVIVVLIISCCSYEFWFVKIRCKSNLYSASFQDKIVKSWNISKQLKEALSHKNKQDTVICGSVHTNSLIAQTVKICKMHWKLRIKPTPVLFCKYLRNKSSDLHEILCGVQILQVVLEWLQKSLSLLLRIDINLLAKTGDILLFWLGHFDI